VTENKRSSHTAWCKKNKGDQKRTCPEKKTAEHLYVGNSSRNTTKRCRTKKSKRDLFIFRKGEEPRPPCPRDYATK